MRRAIFALCLLILPAVAQAQSRRFELTPMVGYRFDGEFSADSDLFDRNLDVQVDEGTTFGAIFDIPLTESWQIEILGNRQDSAFVIDDGLFESEQELGDVSIDYLHAGLSYQWGPGQVTGFVSGGLGVARISPAFADSENRVSGNLGGGVKIFFAPNIGIRLEGRGYWVDLDSVEDRRSYRDRYDSEEGLYQGEASAGLIIAF